MATIDIDVARRYSTAGLYRILPFKYTGPSSYATDGEAFGSAELGLEPEIVPDLIAHSGSATRLVVYDYVAKKYVWYVPDTGAEVAAATDLSTFVARGVAYGR